MIELSFGDDITKVATLDVARTNLFKQCLFSMVGVETEVELNEIIANESTQEDAIKEAITSAKAFAKLNAEYEYNSIFPKEDEALHISGDEYKGYELLHAVPMNLFMRLWKLYYKISEEETGWLIVFDMGNNHFKQISYENSYKYLIDDENCAVYSVNYIKPDSGLKATAYVRSFKDTKEDIKDQIKHNDWWFMKPPGMDENFYPHMDSLEKIADSINELDETEKEMFNELLFKPVLFEAEKV